MKTCKSSALIFPFLALLTLNSVRAEEHQHQSTADKHQEATQTTSDKHDEQTIVLSNEQMDLAEIKISLVSEQEMNLSLYAPGEVKANGYTSYYVSPRVESIILQRHVTLGDEVENGQPLVTLFSESVAQAQATYRIAYADWQRVKNLNSDIVSNKNKLSAQTQHIAATSQLKAYGLSTAAIDIIVKDSSSALGEYTLNAQRSGAVLSDDFHQGQRIDAGETIMILADESQLWVEAKLPASEKSSLPKGTRANLSIGNESYQAKVIQTAHNIDSITRTRIVRLLVDNEKDQLHSGMFVDVSFLLKTKKPVMVLPQSALTRSADGDWQVFVAITNNSFIAVEVELGVVLQSTKSKILEPEQEVIGLTPGTKVVTQGAFFIASQAAKSGFDIHNH
ncbi:MAG: cobalt-zinc-cadmium efflux system membrane fusion protein [Alteromonadaceae bacterium]|jgi:cobalt-zinc-cadmium efflux system membrane fusion protein